MSRALPEVATNSLRQNSQGSSPRSLTNRTSYQTIQIIPPGKGLVLGGSGNQFRYVYGTGALQVRPRGDVAGVEKQFWPGTGFNLAKNSQEVTTGPDGKVIVRPEVLNSFDALDIRNTTDKAVWAEFFYGWEEFIDNRLVAPSIQLTNVSIPALCVTDPDTADGDFQIIDKSGETITDANGNQWYAVTRLLLIIENADEDEYFVVTNLDEDRDLLWAMPLTAAQIASGGDFRVNKDFTPGVIPNGQATELYQCLPLVS